MSLGEKLQRKAKSVKQKKERQKKEIKENIKDKNDQWSRDWCKETLNKELEIKLEAEAGKGKTSHYIGIFDEYNDQIVRPFLVRWCEQRRIMFSIRNVLVYNDDDGNKFYRNHVTFSWK